MSIKQTDTIDSIGVDRESGFVMLTMLDPLGWSQGEDDHLVLLQEKLNAYLRFVESGEIFDVYPNAKGRSIFIDLVLKHSPDEEGIEFLECASQIIENAGYKFGFRVFETAK